MRSVDEGIEDLRKMKALGLRGVMMPGNPGKSLITMIRCMAPSLKQPSICRCRLASTFLPVREMSLEHHRADQR